VIARGLPFLVDKPVARDLATARRVGEALRRAGLWASVGYQLRYGAAARRAKAFIEGRTIALVEGHYWCGTGRSGSWHNDWEKSGGQLVEQATHTIDLMRHLAGEVEEVYAQQARRIVTGITSPDAYTVSLRFASGALGSLSTSWAHDPRDWSQANVVHVSLDGCLLRLDGAGASLLPQGREELPEAAGPDLYEAFLEGVRSGSPSQVLSSYDDGAATLAVSLAANESALAHRPLRVSEAVGA
jgi:predicted dehydrogenase